MSSETQREVSFDRPADRNPCMLLVEDNEDDVFLMERALKLAGIANPLKVVTDGEAAIAYLAGSGEYADRAQFPLPFIVFLDLKLPYLSGFEVLQWIRQRSEFENLLVVVMTSSTVERDTTRAYALGARSYLVKPPTAEMLLELVRSLQSFWPKLGAAQFVRIAPMSK